MSWLRLDDAFWHHPKFAGWTPAQKWAFGELMGYCARYRTRGKIPSDLALLPRSVTRNLVNLAEKSGWLDRDENGVLWVHDWNIYNGDEQDKRGALDEKVRAYLQEFPGATANTVCRAVGGNRAIVLALVHKYQNGTDPVPPTSTGTSTESGSHAGASAPVPVPSPEALKASEGRDVSGFARDAADAVNGAASPGRVGRVPAEEPEDQKRRRDVRTNVNPSPAAAVHYARNVGREDPNLQRTLREMFSLDAEEAAAIVAELDTEAGS